MTNEPILGIEFEAAAVTAFAKARQETLDAGIAVFFKESQSGMDVMELPSGHQFEIRYVPGSTGSEHYKIIRELARTAGY